MALATPPRTEELTHVAPASQPSHDFQLDTAGVATDIASMPVPDFQTVMLPLLRDLENGERQSIETVDSLAAHFGLTPEERAQRLPSGRQTTFTNRIAWAKSHLKAAGLVDSRKRGVYTLTERGRRVLAGNPSFVGMPQLNAYPEYVAFRRGTSPPREPAQPTQPIPPDDPRRSLTVARPDDAGSLPHISVAGGTYTILLSGDDTAGRYTLIDMYVPPGGGPPPHRHDFEEMFTVLEGEMAFAFRGAPLVVRAGETVNIPANAPHSFRNSGERPARLLCMCTPPGQEWFFAAVGDAVDSRTAPPPPLSDAQRAERRARAAALAPQYRTELLTS